MDLIASVRSKEDGLKSRRDSCCSVGSRGSHLDISSKTVRGADESCNLQIVINWVEASATSAPNKNLEATHAEFDHQIDTSSILAHSFVDTQ